MDKLWYGDTALPPQIRNMSFKWHKDMQLLRQTKWTDTTTECSSSEVEPDHDMQSVSMVMLQNLMNRDQLSPRPSTQEIRTKYSPGIEEPNLSDGDQTDNSLSPSIGKTTVLYLESGAMRRVRKFNGTEA